MLHVDVRLKTARWAQVESKYVSLQEGLNAINKKT
jgi:hypothetical protein